VNFKAFDSTFSKTCLTFRCITPDLTQALIHHLVQGDVTACGASPDEGQGIANRLWQIEVRQLQLHPFVSTG
jgi:hypothetical protein